MIDALDKCFSEAKINSLTLRNRLIKAATFEGKSPGGVPSEALIGFHERIGQGGIGMTTIAYCAAEADGRIHEHMMYMHEGIRPDLERFVRKVQATGAKVAGQLGHCGAFTLVTVGDGEIAEVSVLENAGHAQGGCLAPVQLHPRYETR